MNKKIKRELQTIGQFLLDGIVFLSILILIWITCSFFEINAHNTDDKPEYSPYNFFIMVLDYSTGN